MMTKCIGCGANLTAPAEMLALDRDSLPLATFSARPVKWQVDVEGPFPCRFKATAVACRTCNTSQVTCANSVYRHLRETWRAGSELLAEGRDYDTASSRGRAVDSAKRLIIAWAWLPLKDDELDYRLFEAMRVDEDLHRKDRASVLILDGRRLPAWTPDAARLFDSCIILREHVMAGGYGPYPSLRAELSIRKSFAAITDRVLHFWPGAILSQNDYVALAEDAELVSRWANYMRQRITISTGVEHVQGQRAG